MTALDYLDDLFKTVFGDTAINITVIKDPEVDCPMDPDTDCCNCPYKYVCKGRGDREIPY
jgi:hypothetical protein